MRELITVTLMEPGGPTLICPRTQHKAGPAPATQMLTLVWRKYLLSSPAFTYIAINHRVK